MFNTLKIVLLAILYICPIAAISAVAPEGSGYRVTYDIDLRAGTSNGSDVEDVVIFEWNDSGEFSAEYGFSLPDHQRTVLSHVIDFQPTAALVMGWGAAISGVGDEKDHLFTLVNSTSASEFIGNKWSAAFPGVPPEPRTGHNAMIQLLQGAASGDASAVDALTTFVQREAIGAGFNPAGGFQLIEWSTAAPIPPVSAIPTLPTTALYALILCLFVFAWRYRAMIPIQGAIADKPNN